MSDEELRLALWRLDQQLLDLNMRLHDEPTPEHLRELAHQARRNIAEIRWLVDYGKPADPRLH